MTTPPMTTPPMTIKHRINVAKRARQLSLLSESELMRTYPIALGRNSEADKSVEGDEATPLGEFYICAKNPRSRYFLSLCISYPNAEDAERGLAAGLISVGEHAQILDAVNAGRMPPQKTRLGGEIYIHGHGDGDVHGERGEPRGTRGCIALKDPDMQDLYDRVCIGTPVIIVP
jgi:murein L,D-transpeptidase YafK